MGPPSRQQAAGSQQAGQPTGCAFPGVRRRVEEPVAAHLEAEGLQFIQFAFRWVNCLLLREVPFPLAVRLWDTYLSEG